MILCILRHSTFVKIFEILAFGQTGGSKNKKGGGGKKKEKKGKKEEKEEKLI